VNVERAFNAREGMTRSDDSLPRRFRVEKLTEGASAGTVFDQEPLLDEYYSERGWDLETGLHTRRALEMLGLGYVADELEGLGRIKR
jgi:aldehyde:ferredoxin oxidoreductase